MNLTNKLLIFVVTLLSVNAYAGFYVEPGITYEKADQTLQWPAPLNDSTGNTKGLGVNLKLGAHIADSFFIGANGYYSQPKFENSINDYSADARSTLYGVVLGAQMPIVGFRLWLGYIFDGELNPDGSGGVDVKFKQARGGEVGIGFKIFMLSMNLEYMDLEYNDTVLEQAGPVSGTIDQKLKSKLGIFSISMPLTL